MLKDEQYCQAFNYMGILERPYEEKDDKDGQVNVELPFKRFTQMASEEGIDYADEHHKMLWANSDNLTRLLYDGENRTTLEKSIAKEVDTSVVGLLKGMKKLGRK